MTTIAISDRIVRYVRGALHSQLGMTAEDIGQATHEGGRAQPALYAEPLQRLDRTRALLDLIGWQDQDDEQPVAVDIAAHRSALVSALRAQVEAERDMASDDPALRGAKMQIARARQRAGDIERLIAQASATPEQD